MLPAMFLRPIASLPIVSAAVFLLTTVAPPFAAVGDDMKQAPPSNKIEARGDPSAATINFPDALMNQIDEWASEHQTTRTEAIRQLVILGLIAKPPSHTGKVPLPRPQVRPDDK